MNINLVSPNLTFIELIFHTIPSIDYPAIFTNFINSLLPIINKIPLKILLSLTSTHVTQFQFHLICIHII